MTKRSKYETYSASAGGTISVFPGPHVVNKRVNSVNDGILCALSKVAHILEHNPSKGEMPAIEMLRQSQFKRYPEVGRVIDRYDQNSCILYAKNDENHVTSTGRIVFDSPMGLPADIYAKGEIDKLREQGFDLVEISKFAIAPEAKGILRFYLWAYYEIAIELGIDALVSINPIKDVRVYEKIYSAEVLLSDIGQNYGTNSTFALLEHNIQRAKPSLSKWLGEKLS